MDDLERKRIKYFLETFSDEDTVTTETTENISDHNTDIEQSDLDSEFSDCIIKISQFRFFLL